MTITDTKRAYHPDSISALSFWAMTAEEREETFKKLRAATPVSWHQPFEGALMPPENDGVWAVASHELIAYVSKNPQLFCSAQGIQTGEVPTDILEAGGEGDFVKLVSERLPIWTIYEMAGLEGLNKREEATRHAAGIVSWADADVAARWEPCAVMSDSLVVLLTMAIEFAEERRANPKADLMADLVNAEVEGDRLTDEEIASFFVRWASSVMTFRLAATQGTELSGQHIQRGEWVALIYSSGNRDESVLSRPDTFDITRDPNPDVGFGGGGPHFCLGNFVAKMQLRQIFDQMLTRAPGLQVGEPEYLMGNFVRSVKSLTCRIR